MKKERSVFFCFHLSSPVSFFFPNMPPLAPQPRAPPPARAAAIARPHAARRVVTTRVSPPVVDGVAAAELKSGIADFYDESSGLWEDMW